MVIRENQFRNQSVDGRLPVVFFNSSGKWNHFFVIRAFLKLALAVFTTVRKRKLLLTQIAGKLSLVLEARQETGRGAVLAAAKPIVLVL